MVAGDLMGRNKAQILVVDDEAHVQEILESTLEDAGYECVAMSDAETALTVLASQNFDIALLDSRIAGTQGTELLQDIKKGYPEVVVLLITTIDDAAPPSSTYASGLVVRCSAVQPGPGPDLRRWRAAR